MFITRGNKFKIIYKTYNNFNHMKNCGMMDCIFFLTGQFHQSKKRVKSQIVTIAKWDTER